VGVDLYDACYFLP